MWVVGCAYTHGAYYGVHNARVMRVASARVVGPCCYLTRHVLGRLCVCLRIWGVTPNLISGQRVLQKELEQTSTWIAIGARVCACVACYCCRARKPSPYFSVSFFVFVYLLSIIIDAHWTMWAHVLSFKRHSQIWSMCGVPPRTRESPPDISCDNKPLTTFLRARGSVPVILSYDHKHLCTATLYIYMCVCTD